MPWITCKHDRRPDRCLLCSNEKTAQAAQSAQRATEALVRRQERDDKAERRAQKDAIRQARRDRREREAAERARQEEELHAARIDEAVAHAAAEERRALAQRELADEARRARIAARAQDEFDRERVSFRARYKTTYGIYDDDILEYAWRQYWPDRQREIVTQKTTLAAHLVAVAAIEAKQRHEQFFGVPGYEAHHGLAQEEVGLVAACLEQLTSIWPSDPADLRAIVAQDDAAFALVAATTPSYLNGRIPIRSPYVDGRAETGHLEQATLVLGELVDGQWRGEFLYTDGADPVVPSITVGELESSIPLPPPPGQLRPVTSDDLVAVLALAREAATDSLHAYLKVAAEVAQYDSPADTPEDVWEEYAQRTLERGLVASVVDEVENLNVLPVEFVRAAVGAEAYSYLNESQLVRDDGRIPLRLAFVTMSDDGTVSAAGPLEQATIMLANITDGGFKGKMI